MSTTPAKLRQCICGLLAAFFVGLLLFPLFQQISGTPPDRQLDGFRYRMRVFPRWTLSSWMRGEFASATDAWINEHVGMRGWSVTLNRQIRYCLFGQVEAAPLRKRALVIGKPPILYEHIVLIDALRPPQIPPETMDAFASRLARVQGLLKEHGMAFLVIVAPNKAIVRPDALPSWARSHVRGHDSDAARFVDTLCRHRVPCLDSGSLFCELRPRYPDLIPAHAIHWGHHGAWLALQHAVPLINSQGVLPPIPVPATAELIMDKPSHMNDELRGQLNLFRSPYDKPISCAYPVAAPLPPGVSPSLNVLVVGDSFAFTFMDALSRSQLCRTIHLWFYMRSVKEATPSFDSRERRGIPYIRGTGLGRGSPENAARMLADKNLVLLIVTTFNIDKMAWDFDRLIFNLYGAPAERALPNAEAEVDLEH